MPSGGKHPRNGYETLLLAKKMPMALLNPQVDAKLPREIRDLILWVKVDLSDTPMSRYRTIFDLYSAISSFCSGLTKSFHDIRTPVLEFVRDRHYLLWLIDALIPCSSDPEAYHAHRAI
jgi:hypothetical protein